MPSLDSLPPGSRPPTDVVSRKVFINGTELSNEVQLVSLSVSKAFNKVASAKMVFADGSVSDRDFPLSNDDNYKPGGTIKIQMGYHGEVTTLFEGIIVKHAIKIKQHGGAFLMIEAKDKAIKLTGTRKSAYFIEKTDNDIITQLAGELQAEVDSTSTSHKQVVQFDATDWDFLLLRAEANGMLVLTDDGKLVVKKPVTTSPPVLTVTYGDNMWEFDGEMDARKQIQGVTSQSWDYTQQQLEVSEAGNGTFTENGNLSADDLGPVMGTQVLLTHTGHLTTGQLQDWSDSYALRNHLSKSAGRVRIEGNADVKPGTMITLAGVGDRFNGNVYVTGVLHSYQGIWQTDVQFGWRDDLFYKKEDVVEKQAAGLIPGIHGLQIGIVTDLDDPDDLRVKVKIPTVSGDDGIWARVSTLDAGAGHGTYFRPQVSDEVILGFLNDDPREPIILGYVHNKNSQASPLPVDSGALQYGIVTKEGVKVILDDTNKRLTLKVTASAGEKSITINDDANALEIKDENNNSIKMSSSGITIEAGAGNVTIKGIQVMIN